MSGAPGPPDPRDGRPAAPEAIARRADRLRDRIAAAGGDPAGVRLIAVTKGFGPEVADAALAAGLRDLGENYAQELVAKVAARVGGPDGPRPVWHFLGRLQTNKVRQLAPHVALWQSVDRPELVREIAKRAPGAEVLVQLDLSGEPQKGGCPLGDVPMLVGFAVDSGLVVRGFMGVGPTGPPAAARPAFEQLVRLADAYELPVRSIGMSADLEVAVAAGATMVRVGTDLFGPRPPRPG